MSDSVSIIYFNNIEENNEINIDIKNNDKCSSLIIKNYKLDICNKKFYYILYIYQYIKYHHELLRYKRNSLSC